MNESGLEIRNTEREMCLMELTDLLSDEALVKKPLRDRWNTTLECISATGDKIDPLCIFIGENVWSTWIPHQPNPDRFKD